MVNLAANALVIEPEVVPVVPERIEAVAETHRIRDSKILITDDEPDFLVFLGAVLEDRGAIVIKASNGDEAIRLAKSEKPDLITLDLSMPGRSGIDVFETLRKDPETDSIPVCIITGNPEMRKLIYDRPVTPPEGYVDKPVDEEGILVNVRKTLQAVGAK